MHIHIDLYEKGQQRELLLHVEKEFDLGPVAMAEELGVSYDTYKNWKSERRKMPAIAVTCFNMMLEKKTAS